MQTLLLSLLLSISSVHAKPTFPENLTGHLKNSPSGNINLYHDLIFVKGGNKILAKSFTDKHGNFELMFYPDKIKSFNFYCKTNDGKVFFLKTIKQFDSDNDEITFVIP